MKHTVAVVRGPGLSNWEMEVYAPLNQWFNLTAIGSTISVNDIQNIQIPVKKLVCFPQYISFLPKFIPVMFTLFGCTQWLSGFDQAVRGADIVHSVELFNGYTVQAVRAKKKGLVKAVTLTVHENIPYLFDNFPAKKALKQEVIAGADRFLAINEMSRQMLLLEGVDDKRIVVIPQSVNTTLFHPRTAKDQHTANKLRSTFGFSQKDFVVLAVGRMVWEKGWYDLIAAAMKLSKRHSNIKFLCIGTGPERKDLESLTSKLGLEKCMTYASLPYGAMSDVFCAADIFAYPTLATRYWNAQWGGGAVAEAMVSGLPIVATLNGGVFDLIGRRGGIFLQPQHFSGLADAIFKLYCEPKLRRKLGTRNRKYGCRHYSTSVVALKIKHFWDDVLK